MEMAEREGGERKEARQGTRDENHYMAYDDSTYSNVAQRKRRRKGGRIVENNRKQRLR